jgi:hypothetical protein
MEMKTEMLKTKPYTVSSVVLEHTVMISNPCGCKFKFDIYEHRFAGEQHEKTVALMHCGRWEQKEAICCEGHFWYSAGEVKTALRNLTGNHTIEVEDSGEGPYKTYSRIVGAMGVVNYRRLEKLTKN